MNSLNPSGRIIKTCCPQPSSDRKQWALEWAITERQFQEAQTGHSATYWWCCQLTEGFDTRLHWDEKMFLGYFQWYFRTSWKIINNGDDSSYTQHHMQMFFFQSLLCLFHVTRGSVLLVNGPRAELCKTLSLYSVIWPKLDHENGLWFSLYSSVHLLLNAKITTNKCSDALYRHQQLPTNSSGLRPYMTAEVNYSYKVIYGSFLVDGKREIHSFDVGVNCPFIIRIIYVCQREKF